MRVPSISYEQASTAWNAMEANGNYDASKLQIDYIPSPDDTLTFSELDLQDLADALKDIRSAHDAEAVSRSGGGAVDSQVIEPLHQCLASAGLTTFQLSHLGFWRWMSNVAMEGEFWHFIKWRFGGDKQINWGITNSSANAEVYFCRQWLRAHKMYDESLDDPYHYAKLGGSEIWRSHILRQDFGRDAEFIKAFLDVLYDDSGRITMPTAELRKQFIPAVRAWTSNSTFSHLSYNQCKELLIELRT